MVVYPRWRGELDRTASVVSSGSGLSPLARGTPVFANLWTIAIRFIPAGAGNTGARNTKPCICSVYPRWRGEHLLLELVECCYSGLSPLARGTQRQVVAALRGRRFIPAGAGNTFKYVYLLIAISGLSPLARGTPALFAALSLVARFIPAGAGNTIEIVFGIYSEAVYPRWRGEHFAKQIESLGLSGLSPLARGTH